MVLGRHCHNFYVTKMANLSAMNLCCNNNKQLRIIHSVSYVGWKNLIIFFNNNSPSLATVYGVVSNPHWININKQ